MNNGPFYQGSCGCAAVTLMVTGTPLGAASCDCARCRSAEGAAAELLFWPEMAVQFAGGLDALEADQRDEDRVQYHCRHCGERILTEHKQAGIVEMPAEVLPELSDLCEVPDEDEALLVRLGHRQ